LNLGTKEDPCPIYVSNMLMPEEEKEYFSLLFEFRDVFVWSYKEMPALDPKFAVHFLVIKKLRAFHLKNNLRGVFILI